MIHFSLANKVASGCQIPLPRTATWHALWSFGIKILQGEKPADIPVEQPGKFELAINLRTAKALDLRIAEAFLIRADRASTDEADFRCWHFPDFGKRPT
jgi:ABC transporter substrate binding protein